MNTRQGFEVRSRTIVWFLVAVLAGSLVWGDAYGRYPLDSYEQTGIRRLRAYQMILNREMPGNLNVPVGGRQPTSAIRLLLKDVNDTYDIGPDTQRDSALQAGLQRLVGQRHPSYRVALLDITNPAAPRYAGIRADEGYLPGSIAKLLVMSGIFNELKQLHPNDIGARISVLRDTWVEADRFAMPNSHQVPVVADDWSRVTHRAIQIGDLFSLWEWVDHMISPSSNAAGSMVWKEALFIDTFQNAYPPSREDRNVFIDSTPRQELARRSAQILVDPLVDAGLDTSALYLRTYFTGGAQRIIPPGGSLATPRQLLRWLLKLEQGQLVDEWSSLEMKKLLYFTRRRYRFAASPALDSSLVFFKSGSLYQCRPEEGYTCGQYLGNVTNLMHSVAIVESPPGTTPRRVYMVAMMSNVLKVNSAAEHLQIATGIERLMKDQYTR